MVGFGFLVFAAALAVEGYNEYRAVFAPQQAIGAYTTGQIASFLSMRFQSVSVMIILLPEGS